MAKKKQLAQTKWAYKEFTPEHAKAAYKLKWSIDRKRHDIAKEISSLTNIHIKLRDVLNFMLDKWQNNFNAQAELTTNFDKFYMQNISARGEGELRRPNESFDWKRYPISRFYMSGYDTAIKGENPFLDEIQVTLAPSEVCEPYTNTWEGNKPSQELLDTIKGYYESIQDSYVLNFVKYRAKVAPVAPVAPLDDLVNKFDSVAPERIYVHFKGALVDTQYLTENELINYIEFAFSKLETPKDPFIFSNRPVKRKIYKAFYNYYKDIAGKPHGKQRAYAALLGDYFAGYSTATVSTNFSKTY